MSTKINGWAMYCWRGDATTQSGVIGATTNHTLSLNRDMIEKASSTTAREYLPGLIDWSLSTERLIVPDGTDVSVLTEIEDLKAGTEVGVCLLIGMDYYVGTAIIESITLNGPLRGKASASISMRGIGTLAVTQPENFGFDYIFPLAFDTELAADSATS